ncbi:succinate--CoA ligase subunit alpha [Candidatus Woesearchaeota archaeon]|nr:succinate--CoA ligase subunit alpha [Candidatus Woesearchaeota archaeon]
MSILIDTKTRVVVQGMTGKMGQKVTKEMLAEGTVVSCGVTPGKGGQEVEGLPVFDSVAEAKAHDAKLNTSVILVPPLLVMDAAMEAMDAGLELVVIITENVPIKDAARIVAYAAKTDCRVIGPSSTGLIAPGKGKIGPIGSAKEKDMYSPGTIGVISKSGGMCAETSRLLTKEGLGQSTVVGVGGDVIAGTTFADLLPLFEADPETEAIVLFAEIGGAYEEIAAELIKAKIKKPVVAFVSGTFAEKMGKGLALGHAGAIVEEGFGTAKDKKKALKDAGVLVADYHHDIPALVKQALKR